MFADFFHFKSNRFVFKWKNFDLKCRFIIPLDFKFIFDSAHFNIINHCLDAKNRINNHQAVVVVKIAQSKIKKATLFGLVLEMSMYIHSQLYATKTMDISFFQPKIWEKLRRSAQK